MKKFDEEIWKSAALTRVNSFSNEGIQEFWDSLLPLFMVCVLLAEGCSTPSQTNTAGEEGVAYCVYSRNLLSSFTWVELFGSKMNTSTLCTYKAYDGWRYILQKWSVQILKQICFGWGLVCHPWSSVPVKTDVEAVCPEAELRTLCSHGKTGTLGSLGTWAAQSRTRLVTTNCSGSDFPDSTERFCF